MAKYYYGVVNHYYDDMYSDVIKYKIPGEDSYLKKVILKTYQEERGFLGFKSLVEYFISFPIMMEEIDENILKDLVTGEEFRKLANSELYKGNSSLLFKKGMEIEPVTVAKNLRRLFPDDINRYYIIMNKLKRIADNRAKEDMVLTNQIAEEYIKEFKSRKK